MAVTRGACLAPGMLVPARHKRMSATITAVRPRRSLASRTSADATERRIRRRIYITYGLLFFNTLTFFSGTSVMHIPGVVGKGLQQGALPVAVLMALSLNRRVHYPPERLPLPGDPCSCWGRSSRSCNPSTSVPCSAPSGSPSSWSRSGC